MLNQFFSRITTIIVTTTVVSCSLIFPETAQAFKLFSVETDSNSLVSIDSETGQVDVIGTLDFDVNNSINLANIGNQLFAINSQFGVRVDLFEINPFNASTISSVQVTNGGTPILSAEGFTNFENELLIGFSSNGDVLSESLGDLAFDGSITNVRSTSSLNDFDALGGNETTGVFANDTNAVNNTSNFFTVNVNTGGTSFVDSSFPFINDLTVIDNNIFAANASSDLFRFSTSGVLLETINLSQSGTYVGLALNNTDTISVPESSNFLALGMFGLLGIFALKRSKK